MSPRCLIAIAAALYIRGVVFAQPVPVNDPTEIKQPDSSDNGTQNGPNSKSGAGSSFQVSYGSNFNQGPVNVRVVNTGAAGGVGDGGYICVNMYTFNTAQAMQSCCSCLVSPNALATLPVSGSSTTPMVVKLLSTYPNNTNGATVGKSTSYSYACDATVSVSGASFSGYVPTHQYLAPGMAAWTDSTLFASPNHFQVRFEKSVFSQGEAASLAYKCAALGPATTCASCPVEQFN